jgi:ABC-type multidrug transport system, ATPase component
MATKPSKQTLMWALWPLGGGLLVAILYSFFPSVGSFAPYVWAFFFFFVGAYALLWSLPFWVNKIYPPKAFKSKKLTDLYLKLAVPENRITLIRKALVLFVALVFFIRFYFDGPLNGPGDALVHIVSRQCSYMNEFETSMSSICFCLWTGSVIWIAVSEFLPTRTFQVVRKYLISPALLLCVIFFARCLEGVVGDIPNEGFQYRALLMGIELGTMAAILVDDWRRDHTFKLNRSDVYALVVAWIVFLLTNPTTYLVQNLIGLTNPFMSVPLKLNGTHRILLYISIALPVIYYFLLHPFDKDHRRAFLTCISFGVFFGYISSDRYSLWSSVTSWPLHICNTAMYTMPFTLVFQLYGLFYFTMFVNVIGAFLALMMPNYSATLAVFDPSVFHFYINHFYAFFLPVLVICLGVYKRPKMKYFLYSMVGFFFYYALVVFVNNYMTPRLPEGQSIDFFFINSNFIADKLGEWANKIFKQTLSFTAGGYTYEIHVLYLILYYLVYCGLSFAMWYVYELLFRGVDEMDFLLDEGLRRRKLRYATVNGANWTGKLRGTVAMKKNIQVIEQPDVEAQLAITHLTKRYGNAEQNAVTDFSLSISGGKIYGFLGKNGAGKSTIIKAVVGLHGFNEGTISVCGRDIVEEPSEAKMLIGYVPDNYALYENLTGRQYVSYIADLYKVSRADREKRLPDLLSRLEMTEHFNFPIKTYSHGMKQKITIIAALIHEPKIWILDEPMTGLDPNSIFQIKELMRHHASKGNIVFFSSHIIDVVENLCDEVFIIKHGNLIEHDSIPELKKKGLELEPLFLRLTSDSEDEAKALLKEEALNG